MSKVLKFKRRDFLEIMSMVGSDGELIIDTTNKTITVHDGVTPGGRTMMAVGGQFGDLNIGTLDPSSLTFITDGVDAMVIDELGDIYIGQDLDVAGNINANTFSGNGANITNISQDSFTGTWDLMSMPE